jgi:hypothetical protein
MFKLAATGRRYIVWQSSVYANYLTSMNDEENECLINNIYRAIVEREVFSLAEAMLREKLEGFPYQTEYGLQRQYELENVEIVTFIEHVKEWMYKYHDGQAVRYIPVAVQSSINLKKCMNCYLSGINKRILYETII